MKSFQEKYGRVIDFEGTKKNGIQQAAVIDHYKFKIISYNEYSLSDGNFQQWLIDSVKGRTIDYWVAHNAHVEKIIIKETAPYQISTTCEKVNITWGPWIDTLKVYKMLYPRIEDYKLRNLAEIFLDMAKINVIAQQICKRNAMTFHQAMYDSLITLKLMERLNVRIDLGLFLD